MVSKDEWKLGAISPLILDDGGAHCVDDGYVLIIVSKYGAGISEPA